LTFEDNLDLVKKMLSAFENHDLDKFVEYFDENALDYVPSRKEPLKGRDEIRKDNEEFISLLPDVHFEIKNAFGQDNWLCIEGNVTGTYKGPNEMTINVPSCMVVKIQGKKVKELHEYFDQSAFQH
jgi:limonene-1,2-epoxide hydrolase